MVQIWQIYKCVCVRGERERERERERDKRPIQRNINVQFENAIRSSTFFVLYNTLQSKTRIILDIVLGSGIEF